MTNAKRRHTQPLWTKRKVFGPNGLSAIVVWFDDLFWPDGPVCFHRNEDAQTYIVIVLHALSMFSMIANIAKKYEQPA